MNKETSSRVSSIAARIMRTPNAAEGPMVEPVDYNSLLEDAKALAGSCMSQDETPGQVPAHQPTFIERLKIEREELDERVTKLAHLISNQQPQIITNSHWELLKRQLITMSEYLVILDERLTDLGIAARSAPVEEIPIGNEDDGA